MLSRKEWEELALLSTYLLVTGRVLVDCMGCRALRATTARVAHRCNTAEVLSMKEPEQLALLSSSPSVRVDAVDDGVGCLPLFATTAGLTHR